MMFIEWWWLVLVFMIGGWVGIAITIGMLWLVDERHNMHRGTKATGKAKK